MPIMHLGNLCRMIFLFFPLNFDDAYLFVARAYNHNSIYTAEIVVRLREIAIQEVHPSLVDQQLNEARTVEP